MPYKQQIAEMGHSIERVLAILEVLRAKGGRQSRIEKLLGQLARLKAERVRLMDHQRLFSK